MHRHPFWHIEQKQHFSQEDYGVSGRGYAEPYIDSGSGSRSITCRSSGTGVSSHNADSGGRRQRTRPGSQRGCAC